MFYKVSNGGTAALNSYITSGFQTTKTYTASDEQYVQVIVKTDIYAGSASLIINGITVSTKTGGEDQYLYTDQAYTLPKGSKITYGGNCSYTMYIVTTGAGVIS